MTIEKIKPLLVGAICGALLLVIGISIGSYSTERKRAGGVVVHNVSESFDEGIEVDGTTAIDGSRNANFVTSTVSRLQVDSGSPIEEHSCNTVSIDPANFSSSSPATTTLALAGAAVGDLAFASFDSTTSTDQWTVEAKITAAATSTAYWRAVPGTAAWNAGLNLTTSTLRVCYSGY